MWWIIRGLENGRARLGNRLLPKEARLKRYRNERHTAKPSFRIHDVAPVFFNKGMEMTLRNGETRHGALRGKLYLNPPSTGYTTDVRVYEW